MTERKLLMKNNLHAKSFSARGYGALTVWGVAGFLSACFLHLPLWRSWRNDLHGLGWNRGFIFWWEEKARLVRESDWRLFLSAGSGVMAGSVSGTIGATRNLPV
jgi:hypothetical protein